MVALLGGSALLVTVVLHLSYLPRYFPEDRVTSSLTLLAGWVTFTLVFYAVGRLISNPGPMPSMRSRDIGTGLFLVSLLLALGLDSFGFTPEVAMGAYVLPALGIYAGLAFIGWSIGLRTNAINRIVSGNGR